MAITAERVPAAARTDDESPAPELVAQHRLREVVPGRRRVLCVNASGHFAGAEAMLVDLLARIDRERWAPEVVVPFEGVLADELRRARVDVHVRRLATFTARAELRRPAALLRLGRRLPASARELARLIAAEGVALVHSNSSVVLDGALAAHLAGVPHVWHVREVLAEPRRAWAVLRWVIAALSARVVCVSHGVRRHFGRLPKRLRRRLVVVPDGVDIEEFSATTRAVFPWPARCPVVGTVGRINGLKGQEDFLRAAALVAARRPDVRFVVVGGALPAYADIEHELQRLTRDLGLAEKTVFAGQLPRQRVRAVLAGLSVFVMPSRVQEGFGLAALEAMAAGVPVVGTEPGARELLADGRDGFLVPACAPEALSEPILRLLGDPALARCMAGAAHARARKELTIEQHVAAVANVYAEAACSRSARR